jgi:hypothetical protein
VDLHYAALNADGQALKAHVVALTGLSPGPRAVAHAPRDWRRRASAATPRAAALGALLQDLLTRDDRAAEYRQREGLGPVSQSFGALWDTLNTP